jgi:hypothetical protein
MRTVIRLVLSIIPLSALLFTFSLTPFDAAAAVPDAVTLLPGARAEYRFDYRGDRTQIDVALDAEGAVGLEMFIYTPAQLDEARRGKELVAIAQGTRNSGHDLFWSGGFPAPGVYEVAVENLGPAIIAYRLDITGESVSGVSQLLPPPAPAASNLANRTLTVPLPPGAGNPAFSIKVPGAPAACTHAYQLPPVIYSSIKLCPNEGYPPLRVVGSGIGVFGDDAHTAIISAGGRQYALTVEGSGNIVDGVIIQASADAADLGAWLCQYEQCVFEVGTRRVELNGGVLYGGGILLKGSNSVIRGVTVRGGTIGVATVDGRGNLLLDNDLSELNGWGMYNWSSNSSYFVNNKLNRENHACTTPDGYKFLHGCETAGWVCLACQNNVVAQNQCEGSANCYYMSGERGLASNNNRFVANYCGGATDNCFEITFSKGNVLRDNVTGPDPLTGAACKYPFWMGGSAIVFGSNLWHCAFSADESIARATASTPAATVPLYSEAAFSAVVSPPPASESDTEKARPIPYSPPLMAE